MLNFVASQTLSQLQQHLPVRILSHALSLKVQQCFMDRHAPIDDAWVNLVIRGR